MSERVGGALARGFANLNGVGNCLECGQLLADYDPVPGLVARGVMSDEHDPESCDLACCDPAEDAREGGQAGN